METTGHDLLRNIADPRDAHIHGTPAHTDCSFGEIPVAIATPFWPSLISLATKKIVNLRF